MKNLMPVIMIVAELGNVGDQMGRTQGAARYIVLMQLFDEVTGLANVDFDKVDDEFKAALNDSAQMDQIQKAFADKLDIEDDKLEAFIEEGILLVKRNYEIIKEDIEFIKKLKKA